VIVQTVRKLKDWDLPGLIYGRKTFIIATSRAVAKFMVKPLT
jgi:hypothetical protein